jgi:hypothetical protein
VDELTDKVAVVTGAASGIGFALCEAFAAAGILGGGAGIAWAAEHSLFTGLIGVLVLVAAILLAVDGAYPRGLFDYVIGLNRWVVRVVAYGALMTTTYPPFLLDKGEREPTHETAPTIAETSV